MLCKRCMTVMGTGTTYEQNKDGKHSHKRYYECKNKKCGYRFYTNEPNFQEYMNKASEKCRNR